MTTIKLNSTDTEEILLLQKLLRKVGYPLSIDGIFDSKTDKTIRDFQFSNSLIADGVVNPLTWEVLFSKASKSNEELLGTDIFQGDATYDEAFWAALKDKYLFCFVKSTEGATYKDPRFEEHIKSLKEQKILRGGYHFFRLLNEDVDGQIHNFLNSGLDYREKGVLPPVLNIEPSIDDIQNKRISLIISERTKIAQRMKHWLNVVEQETGKRPFIYTSKNVWDDILKSPTGFENYPLWVADYSTEPKPNLPNTWVNHAIRQFTDSGTIAGKSDFNVNRLNISYSQLLSMAGF